MSNFYAESISFLLNHFNTDLENGLSHENVIDARKRHGVNEHKSKMAKSEIGLFFEQVLNWKLLLLIATAVIFALTDDDTLKIPRIVFISSVFIITLSWSISVGLNLRKKQNQCNTHFNVTVSVIRQGKQEKCSPREIVPGDLLLLKPGNFIPADARIVQTEGLTVNESALFGSSGSAQKSDNNLKETGLTPEKQTNMVFGGTYVDSGMGKAIVVRTGKQLEMYKHDRSTRTMPNEMTVAENQIKFFVDILRIIGVVAGTIATAIFWWNESHQTNAIDWQVFVKFGLLFVMAATPHDLLLLLNTILTQKIADLIKIGVVLRNRQFLERLNRLTAFCSDEKGIASRKALTISNIYVDEQLVNRPIWESWLKTLDTLSKEDKSTRVNSISPRFQVPQGAPGLVLTAGLGTSGERYYDRSDIDHAHQQVIKETMKQLGHELIELQSKMELVAEYPWTSNFGYELHVFQSAENEYLNILYGDARNVLEACHYILVNKELKEFSYDQYEMSNEILNYMQNSRDTVYGVASVHSEVPLTPPEVQRMSTFLGFIGFSANDDEEIREAIKAFTDTGLKVILISGSDEQSTTDLARELGLIHSRNAVGTREEMMNLSTQEFDKEVPNWNAYSQPTQEQRRNIVLSLKRHNHSVGFLGRDVNDQRAMITANLAFADTRYASHFALEHADCLIVERGFKAVKDCLFFAREAYQNLSGSLRWCLSCTLSQFLTVIFGLLLFVTFEFEMPLTITQVIWVQFLTTMLPALGLGFEKIYLNEKQQRPGRAVLLLPKNAILDVVCRSVVISLMTIIHFLVLTTFATNSSIEVARTAACTTLIFTQVASYFQCTRYPWESLFKRMFANIRLFFILIGIIGLHLGVMYVEPLHELLEIVPLQEEWIVTSLCSLILLLLPLNLAINPRRDGH